MGLNAVSIATSYGLVLLAASLGLLEPAGAQASYSSTYEALMALNQTRALKATIVGFLTSPQGLTQDIIQRYQYILPIVQSKTSTLTSFVSTNEAFDEFRQYMCMTQEESEQYSSNNPAMVMDNIEQQLANTTKALYSKDFRDGMTLPTFNNQVRLVLKTKANKDGSVTWVLPGMAQNGSDVSITQSDITTGSSVMHLIDGILTDDAQKLRNKKIRDEFCSRSNATAVANASSRAGPAAVAAGTAAQSSAGGRWELQLWCWPDRWVGLLATVGVVMVTMWVQF